MGTLKSIVRLFCFLLLLFIIASYAYSLDIKSKIDPFASRLIEDKLAVGLVVGIYNKGERQIIGYGETKKGSGILPDGKTIYEIGSLTKVFTGTILADMVNRGEVKLEDPVNQFLPNNGKLHDSAHPVTLLSLATHTSGLPYVPDGEPTNMQNPYADFTFDDLYAYLDTLSINCGPCEFHYSNTGMGLLGNALATKAGNTYEALVISRICNPLNMSDTRITLTDEMKSRMAPPYDDNLNETKNWDIPALQGAGALRSTCDNMLNFAAACVDTQSIPLKSAFTLALEKHASLAGLPVGLGWQFALDEISRWHNGGTGGYASVIVVIPDSGIAAVVLSNTTAYDRITELGSRAVLLMTGREFAPPVVRKEVSVDSLILQSYIGDYVFNPWRTLIISYKNGALRGRLTDQSEYPLFAESDLTFFYKIVDAQVSFIKDSTGKIEKLILHQGGIDQEAIRKE